MRYVLRVYFLGVKAARGKKGAREGSCSNGIGRFSAGEYKYQAVAV